MQETLGSPSRCLARKHRSSGSVAPCSGNLVTPVPERCPRQEPVKHRASTCSCSQPSVMHPNNIWRRLSPVAKPIKYVAMIPLPLCAPSRPSAHVQGKLSHRIPGLDIASRGSLKSEQPFQVLSTLRLCFQVAEAAPARPTAHHLIQPLSLPKTPLNFKARKPGKAPKLQLRSVRGVSTEEPAPLCKASPTWYR